MKSCSLGLLAISLLSAKVGIAMAQSPPKDAIQILDSNAKYYGLVVPVGKLLMLVPRGEGPTGLVIAKHENKSRRYFYFMSRDSNTILSGWFEPAQSYKGVKEFWAAESASYKGNPLIEAHDVSFSQSSNWDVISYKTFSQSVERAHVRAHWVQADTWIDVHISTPTLEPALKLLSSIDVSLLEK